MSTTSVRIKDSVYHRLELNAKGYEAVSDTISRANDSLEICEALEMIDAQMKICVEDLSANKASKEIVFLIHFQEKAIHSAMDLVKRLYPEYEIECDIKINACVLNVRKKGE